MFASLLLSASLVTATPPNVVLILIDDLGWQDTSLAFGLDEKLVGRHFRTPVLDGLARNGVQVNQAYASCPVCTPSRVALLTGENPARNHVTSWVHSGQETDGPHPEIDLPDWRKIGFQPGDAPTLAEAFRKAGYHTLQVGKAHFGAGGTAGADPENLGFERSIGGSAAGHPSSYLGTRNFAAATSEPGAPPAHNDVPDLAAYHGKDVFLDDALAIEAAKDIKISLQSNKPVFVWFSPYSVHTPITANARFLANYTGMNETEAAYATMVETCDAAIGTLINTLREANQLDNTIFVFTSDNGGLSQTARGGFPNLHNLPLRSGKGSAYEGGYRVPLVFSGAGVARGATLDKTWIVGSDLADTIADLAGVSFDGPDAESFAGAVRSGTDVGRVSPNVWHYPHHRGFGGPGLEPFSAIRKGNFKAIFFYGDRRWELYNLQADLGETRDVKRNQPERMKELATDLLAELYRLGAQFPTERETGREILPMYE
ncbi:MAG: sulfatase-like hydrolase/transferase [Fimbriimonadaceae bacterium]|nr:sulfatase-like hydrolase/transferase [Fimbriimonadaceae bacterium]